MFLSVIAPAAMKCSARGKTDGISVGRVTLTTDEMVYSFIVYERIAISSMAAINESHFNTCTGSAICPNFVSRYRVRKRADMRHRLERRMTAAKNLSELQDQIRTRYGELSKRLQQVAKYLIDNKNIVAMQTVAAIAKEAGVPPSTLIRFASTFGFSGFNEMKQIFRLDLVKETASYTERARLFREMEGDASVEQPHEILQEFVRANTQSMQQLVLHTPEAELRQAVELLADAETIYVMGSRRSFSAAVYLRYALSHLERRTVLLDGLGGMLAEQLALMGSRDVVVSISFSPYAEETVTVSQKAAQVGARQIVVTDSQISPMASLSDVCFVIKEAQVDAFRSQAATLCLLQSLAVSLAFKKSEE